MMVEKLVEKTDGDYSTDFDEVFARLKQAAGVQSDVELSKELGIRQSSVSGAKKRKAIPPSWITTVSKKFHVSADWLLYGEGPMKRSEKSVTSSEYGVPISFSGPTNEKRKWVFLREALPRLCDNEELTIIKNSLEFVFEEGQLRGLGDTNNLVAMYMPGNDMHPIIKDKNCIIIDVSSRDLVSGCLYALSIGDIFLIRFVNIGEDKISLSGEGCKPMYVDHKKIKIHGRVVLSITSL